MTQYFTRQVPSSLAIHHARGVGIWLSILFLSGCDRSPEQTQEPKPVPTAELTHRLPPTSAPSSQTLASIVDDFDPASAYISGRHRNLFAEYNLAFQEEVQEKVKSAYQQLFFGDNQRAVMYSHGEDMAYILDTGNSDIRSEGMSYGMIIAVMMNDQKTFNKLWRFSKAYMQRVDGDQVGYFAWQLSAIPPFRPLDFNAAPDGEEYFVTALFFAHKRWGNGEGIFDYQAEANSLLDLMVNKRTERIRPMFHATHKQVVFSPAALKDPFTDPSYHLPAFYELWALWADSNNQFWHEVAQVSRDFLFKMSHPQTGLFPEYATFGAKPKESSNERSHHSAYDSLRVIQNMAVDYAWFSRDKQLQELVLRQLTFLYRQGLPGAPRQYVSVYTLDGQPLEAIRATSSVAMNAVGLLAVTEPSSEGIDYSGFVRDLWEVPVPSGKYRYYSGMLYMLALLHVSGEFKIYGNPQLK